MNTNDAQGWMRTYGAWTLRIATRYVQHVRPWYDVSDFLSEGYVIYATLRQKFPEVGDRVLMTMYRRAVLWWIWRQVALRKRVCSMGDTVSYEYHPPEALDAPPPMVAELCRVLGVDWRHPDVPQKRLRFRPLDKKSPSMLAEKLQRVLRRNGIFSCGDVLHELENWLGLRICSSRC